MYNQSGKFQASKRTHLWNRMNYAQVIVWHLTLSSGFHKCAYTCAPAPKCTHKSRNHNCEKRMWYIVFFTYSWHSNPSEVKVGLLVPGPVGATNLSLPECSKSWDTNIEAIARASSATQDSDPWCGKRLDSGEAWTPCWGLKIVTSCSWLHSQTAAEWDLCKPGAEMDRAKEAKLRISLQLTSPFSSLGAQIQAPKCNGRWKSIMLSHHQGSRICAFI